MLSIKLIEPNTDLSSIEMNEFNWDIVVDGKEYKCFRIPDYIHTIGGRYGCNDLWVCPRDERPTAHNLIEFNGEPVRYGIVINENNYTKEKWDETEVMKSVSCRILRNDKVFYSFVCNDIAYAYSKAYQLITSIEEGVINFNRYNYAKEEIIGRHIWWKGKPYTLCTYMEGQCCSMAVPFHIDVPKDFWSTDYADMAVKLDLLEDNHIGWFCEDY